MIDIDLILECHLDYNNNYIVHYILFHRIVLNYNKMKKDYMNMLDKDYVDNNKVLDPMIVMKDDNNIDWKMYNFDYMLMNEKIVERDNMEWLETYLILKKAVSAIPVGLKCETRNSLCYR